MLCAISGEPVVDAVVSPKSGSVFERKHIVNYLSTTPSDPINNEPLTVEELVPLKSTTPSLVPPVTGTSIPSLLSTFQNEWDALALEVFTLRKQLHKAREELSSALYHQDAAVRVAANAIRERDEAREALQQLASSIGEGNFDHNPAANGPPTIPVDDIQQAREELYQLHRSIKPSYVAKPDAQLEILAKGDVGKPFDQATADYFDASAKQYLIGGQSGVQVYDLRSESESAFIEVNQAVSAVSSGPSGPLVATSDSIFLGDQEWPNPNGTLINSIIVHPSLRELYIAVSAHSWTINSTATTQPVLYTAPAVEHTLTAGDIHVDGALVAFGSDKKQVHIHNTTDGQLVSTVETTYAEVTQLKFAPNGYWLLVGSRHGDASALEVVDLRKNVAVHTVALEGLVDFAIDPSSSVIVTCDTNGLAVHRYVKKGKKWLDHVTSVEVDGDVRSVAALTGHADPEYQEGRIGLGIVKADSSVVEYQISA